MNWCNIFSSMSILDNSLPSLMDEQFHCEIARIFLITKRTCLQRLPGLNSTQAKENYILKHLK